jgi:hypothetical protein
MRTGGRGDHKKRPAEDHKKGGSQTRDGCFPGQSTGQSGRGRHSACTALKSQTNVSCGPQVRTGPRGPPRIEALYVAEESYGARPVSGFADAPGRRDDIVAYADDSNLVTLTPDRHPVLWTWFFHLSKITVISLDKCITTVIRIATHVILRE